MAERSFPASPMGERQEPLFSALDRKLVALADLEYVLAWLRQSEAPENIIGLQERAANIVAGREVEE